MPHDQKIAVLGPFQPYRGGIAHHTTLLANTLAQAHDVFGVNFTRLYPGFLFPGKTQYDESADPLQSSSYEVRRLLDSIGPVSWWRTARAISQSQARWLLLQWWHPFFAPSYAAVCRLVHRKGVRSLFLCHNVLPHESRFVDGALVRLGLGAADGFILQNEKDRQILEDLFPDAPNVVTPHPAYTFFAQGKVEAGSAKKKLGVEGPVVLFFGLIRRYKGLDVLLRAFAQARRQTPMTLVVAGEFYDDRRKYERLAEELGLDDHVRFEGRYIPNEEVETFFKAADLVVLPYRSATQSGIAQIAFSFARPVIVTDVGGLPEAVEEGRTGFVVPAEDPESLGQAMVRFFRDGLDKAMQVHLAAAVRAFSWDAMSQAVERLCRRVDSGSP